MSESTERYLQEVSSRLNVRRAAILETESETLYRDIFEQLPISIWVEDWSAAKVEIDRLKRRGVKNWQEYLERRPDLVAELMDAIEVTDVSEATVGIYHANCKADVLVSTLAENMSPQELAAGRDMVVAFAGGATRFEAETEEQAIGGETVITHTRAVIPPAYYDSWSRVLYVIDDITKLAHAEINAAAIYSQFTDAIESVSDGFCLFDAQGRLVLCNDVYRSLHGYNNAETEPGIATYDSLGVLDELRGDGSTEFLSFQERLNKLRQGESLRIVRTAAGRFIERRQHATSDGGIISIQSDVTDRKQAEDALRASEGRLKAIIDNSPTAISLKGIDGRYIVLNHEYERIIGQSGEAAVGKTSHDLFDKAFAESGLAHDQAVIDSGEAVEREEELVLKDGVHTLLTVKFPVRDPDGTMVAIGGISADITDRRRAEAALQMTQFSVDQVALSIYWIAPDGRFLYVNRHACDELGYSRDELLTMGLKDIAVDVDDAEVRRHWKRLKKKGSISFEGRHRARDGRILTVWINTNYMAFDGREYNFSFVQDIAERKRADEALRHSEEQLQSMAANVPGAVFRRVLKADGSVEYPYVSDRHRELFGIEPEDLMADAACFENYVHPEDYPHWEEVLRLSAESLATQEIEMRLVTGTGEVTWVQSIAQPRRLDNGDVVWDGIVLDITERKEAEQRIDYLAHHDTLTDLPNRALFQDRLATAIAQAQRHGKLLAVHFMDLNRFKEVNDALGHPVGDELLRAVAADLKRVVRATDTVARLGGDEFAVIETELDSPQGAVVLAQKVIDALSQPYKLGEHEVRTGTTIGIAVYPNDGTSPEDLLQNADFALYAGKAKQRDGFEVFDPDMSAALKASKELEVELHRALEKAEFVLHYQPRVSLATGAIIGAEALVRWMHPERGMISPGEFIPVAESSGLVRPLGEWVLRTACHEANSWQRAGLPPLSVAVNLSATQFHGTDIVATVGNVLDESLLDPGLLELEITETMMMRERDSKVAPTLQSLSDLGVEISVDDFGTGYASLTYLRRFPVSKVKIDQSFVAGIVDDRDDKAIVQAVIGLGRGLNMSVTAEGVETREQLEILKAWKCDEAQGFYFGRSMPADELVGLLKTRYAALG
jgi:diguanylate cyclase (GGDEF)-like protein/PAS domain S-box-containing protein